MEIPKDIAGLLCSAIISDTLMFRSPTCTPLDKDTALRLAEIAQVDVEQLAQEMFQAGSDFESKTEEEILNQDFKIFYSGDISFGVSQISAMSRQELDKVQERIGPKLQGMLSEKKLDMMFVMLTDILTETTKLIYCGDGAESLVRDAYNMVDPDGVILKGVVSRKKQLIPTLMAALVEKG